MAIMLSVQYRAFLKGVILYTSDTRYHLVSRASMTSMVWAIMSIIAILAKSSYYAKCTISRLSLSKRAKWVPLQDKVMFNMNIYQAPLHNETDNIPY